MCAGRLQDNVSEINEFCLRLTHEEFHIPNMYAPRPHKCLRSVEGAPFGIHSKPVVPHVVEDQAETLAIFIISNFRAFLKEGVKLHCNHEVGDGFWGCKP
jgi:hypothetical protein